MIFLFLKFTITRQPQTLLLENKSHGAHERLWLQVSRGQKAFHWKFFSEQVELCAGLNFPYLQIFHDYSERVLASIKLVFSKGFKFIFYLFYLSKRNFVMVKDTILLIPI